MKTITIKFFANFREIVGKKTISISLIEDTNIRDIKVLLTTDYPRLKALFHNVLFVVDGKIALDDFIPPDDAVITILPRIGGG